MTKRVDIFLVLMVALLQLGSAKETFSWSCDEPLGLEDGRITNDRIVTLTPVYDNDYEFFGAHQTRLRSNFSFRTEPSEVVDPRNANQFHFVRVQLPEEMIVTGIATQGYEEDWVTEYILMFGVGDENLDFFRNQEGKEELFEGNVDGSSVKFNQVYFPVVTSTVALSPKTWHNNIALRLELYGCKPGYFFVAMLMVSETPFTLSYTNRQNGDTQDMEKLVLVQIGNYLRDVPGYLSAKLRRFSPFPSKVDSTSRLTAELEMYCVRSRAMDIVKHLNKVINNKEDKYHFFSRIVQIPDQNQLVGDQWPSPVVRIPLSKDANMPTQTVARPFSRYLVKANLQPGCNTTKRMVFTWEMASVDSDLGTFSQIFLYGKQNEQNDKIKIFTDSRYLRLGLQYVRCRVTPADQLHAFTYDYGFLQTVVKRPVKCHATPAKGTAVLTEFTLVCTGGYGSVTPLSYTVTLNSSHGPVTVSVQKSLNVTITLPTGRPVRLKVEVKYSSLPSLFADLSIEVKQFHPSRLDHVVTMFQQLMKAKNYEEAAYRSWTLLATIREDGLDTASRSKVKMDIIQSLIGVKFTSLQHLTHVTASVALANEKRDETNPKMQEDSLNIIERAVRFLTHQPPQDVHNINDIATTLLMGAGNILTSAAEDAGDDHTATEDAGDGDTKLETNPSDLELAKENTRKAVRSIHHISEMRRKFLHAQEDVDKVQLHSDGVVISLAKINSESVVRTHFRIRENEIQFPEEIFTGNKEDGHHSISLQIIRFEKSPYSWESNTVTRNLPVMDVSLWSSAGVYLNVSELSSPIKLTFLGGRRERDDKESAKQSLSLKKKGMRYHIILIPSHEATIAVSITTKRNITLQVYVRYNARPTTQQYDFKKSLHNSNQSSCVKSDVSDGCSSRDRYEFVLPPNTTGHVGRHFLGIEIQTNSTDKKNQTKDRARRSCTWDQKRQKRSCVEPKPAPPTPPPQTALVSASYSFDPATDVDYTLLVTIGTCVFWDEVEEKWSTRGCKVAPESNETRVLCLSNHLSKFSGHLYVAPNKINFDKVAREVLRLGETGNVLVLCTVCVIFAIYIIGMLLARRADKRDKVKIVNSRMSTPEGHLDVHSYEVSIQTGLWYGNGTTARVGILLFGDEGVSDPIFFADPFQEIKLFTRGSVNTFTINLPHYLGHLYKIKIWHDHSGKHPSWFLNQVVVTDVSTSDKWHFVADRWLAVERLDGAVKVDIKVASRSELTRFKSLFRWRAVTNFADKHLCLSLFVKPPQNQFSRRQRLTCLLSIIMVALVTNAMFYRVDNSDDEHSFQVGPLKLSWRQILIGIESALIALPVNILTVLIFRNIKREIPQEDEKEKRTEGFLPPCFLVIGWLLCLLASITAGLFTVFYSFSWGAQISNRWLLSVVVSLFQDILITGPIVIIVNTSLTSLVNRKPAATEAGKGLQQPNSVIHGAGDGTWQQPSEKELQRARGLKIQQRKLRRFFVEVVLYVVFVILLMVVSYGSRKPSSYMLTKTVNDIFGGFYEVKDAPTFWDWYEKELVPGLYAENWYNGQPVEGNGAGLISSKSAFIVGLPRIRQMRMIPDAKCEILQVQPILGSKFKRCLSELSQSNKDTTPFYKPGWIPLINATDTENLHELCPEPWRYKEPSGFGEHLLPYGGGGYTANLGYDAGTALKVKKGLEENNWIDEYTVTVIVEFMVFEPAHLLLSNTMFLLQGGLTGTKTQKIDVVPEFIFPSSGSLMRMFYNVCLLLWMITILVLLCLEMVKMVTQRCSYLRKFFNWVSMLQLAASTCAVVMVLLKENSLRAFLKLIQQSPFGSWKSYEFLLWSELEVTILSVAVVMTTINCVKLIQLNRHVHVMRWTLQSAFRYLYSFSLIILLMALAFAQTGMLLFGANDEAHSTLYRSLGTVLKLSIGIGKLQFQKMSGDSTNALAPVFLFACMLTMTITFTNTFIAILDEAFHSVNGKEHPGDQLGDYMKRRFEGWVDRNSKIVRKPSKNRSARKKAIRRKTVEEVPCLIARAEAPLRAKQRGESLTKMARLAETESLTSDDILFPQQQSEEFVSYQSAREERNVCDENKVYETSSLTAQADEMNEIGISKVDGPFFVATNEELLLTDMTKTFGELRQELGEYSWADEKWYDPTRLSYSSSDGSFAEWDGASMISLVQCCEQHVSNEAMYKNSKGRRSAKSGSFKRRLIQTYIDVSESYV